MFYIDISGIDLNNKYVILLPNIINFIYEFPSFR